ncbi:tandem-95 repeat protein, partial [Flavobacterium rhamnosiphilum]
ALTPGTAQIIAVTNGTVNITAAGAITFTPSLNYNGAVSFPYVINDGNGGTATANEEITVMAVNDNPVVDNDTNVMLEDGTPATGDLTDAGDTDPDGTTLLMNTTPVSGPSNGTIVINADGTYTYTPNANFNGTDVITVEVCDQGMPLPANCVNQTLTITVTPVNDAPVVDNDTNVMLEDGTPATGDLTDAGDSDPDGTTLLVNTTPVSGPTNGTIVINADGTYTYTPNANFNGMDVITVEVCDQGAPLPASCVNQTLTITVNPVNDAPVATLTNSTSIINDGTAKGVSTLTGTDTDGTVVSYIISVLPVPAQGIVLMNGVPVTVNQVLTPLEATKLTFIPAAGFTGTATFIYMATDNGNAASIPSTVNIPVGNTPPTTDDIPNVVLAKDGTAQAIPALTGNDADGAVIAYVIKNLPDPASGVLTLNGVPVTVGQELTVANSAALKFTPNVNFVSDNASFTIAAKDNGGLVDLSPATISISLKELPGIAIIKTATFDDNDSDGFAQVGETITYKFEISNTGNVSLTNVVVTDLLPGIVLTGGPISLGVGQTDTTSFEGKYKIIQADINKGNVVNQAKVTAISPIGTLVSDLSDNETVTDDKPTVLGITGCAIKVFNAISPNGDKKNERFYIQGLECYPDNTVEIYNRWGVLVFERDHYNNEDRAFKGISEGRVTVKESDGLPTGTYYYVLKYKDSESNTHQRAGYLYLNK